MARVNKPRLALFDLDHTLLAGDSDVLWCEFLMDQGVLDRAEFASRNAELEARYRAGAVDAREFAHFYIGLLGGRTPAEWDEARRDFLARYVMPRIPGPALALVRAHAAAGDLVVMTTATNRFISELTAHHFGIDHLLATEPEIAEGRFTGRSCGTLNMRAGKVERLHEWLGARGAGLEAFQSTAYSDSINDLPLLEAVDEPVAVDPDPQLASIARERGWRVQSLRG